MDIRQLEYFIAIVERGSYVRAAEALGVTQSALTQAIGRLEQRVRSKLIDRKRSGAVVTEAGRMLLPRAKLILSEARLAESELQTTKSSTTPRIVLGVGKSVPYDIIPSAIAVLLAKDPDVGITVVEGWSPDLFRQLGEGDLDFVVSAPLPQVGVDLALKQEPLCQQVECPVVGARHPLARLENPSLRDLAEHRWLAPPRGNDGRIRFLQRIFQDAGVDPPLRFLFSDSTQIGTMMLKRGELICHGILEIVDQYLEADEYVVLPFPELQFQRVVSLTCRRRSALHSHALALCEAIRVVCRDRAMRTPNRSRIAGMHAPA